MNSSIKRLSFIFCDLKSFAKENVQGVCELAVLEYWYCLEVSFCTITNTVGGTE